MKDSGTVRFLLNGRPKAVDFHSQTNWHPTTTVLNYLRDDPELRGTKEGCAEGDCGACTVVLVDLASYGALEYQACDACLIFLPMLHGKAIITVEHIGQLNALHPVQQAMVDHDGSQCGYCTPGFIMSLYALHQNHQKPDRPVIADALTGNLCRCTGYRSIMEAAISSGRDEPAVSPEMHQQTLEGLNGLNIHPIAIIGNHQKYFQPFELKEAIKLKSMYPGAILVSGATDIALKVTKNDELLTEIIDLSRVEELQRFDKTTKALEFGAGLSLERVKVESKETLPALYKTLEVFGSLQIRNLATLGGNLGSASPIGDTPPILMAYGAKVKLAGPDGTRSLAISDFITGYRETQLREDEIIVSVTVPIPKDSITVKWYKISKRKDLDISTVSGGFRLELDSTAHVENIALFYGGMAAMIHPANKTMDFLKGKLWERSVIEEAVDYINHDFTPITDARAGAEGRKVMARNLLMKFWSETHE